jgi:hypothetical protein
MKRNLKKFKKKRFNIATIERNAWNYIKEDPWLRVMHKDEILARELEAARNEQINRGRKRISR